MDDAHRGRGLSIQARAFAISGQHVSFFATFVLVFVLIFRPQEILAVPRDFRLLDVLTGLAALGVAWDFATQKAKDAYSPQLPVPWRIRGVFVLLVGAVPRGEGLGLATTRTLIATAAMLVVMYGTRTFARLRALMALLVVLAVFVAGVAVHQAQVDPVCIELPISAGESIDSDPGTSDGRVCATKHDCAENGKTDIDYVCERIGLFKTVSIQRPVPVARSAQGFLQRALGVSRDSSSRCCSR